MPDNVLPEGNLPSSNPSNPAEPGSDDPGSAPDSGERGPDQGAGAGGQDPTDVLS